MKNRTCWVLALAVLAVTADSRLVRGAPLWRSLVPFRRVEADANRAYWLDENNGPWMILAASFVGGRDAEQQARELILELRGRYNLPAYLHKRTFDYTKPVRGLGLNPDGTAKMMKYATALKYDEFAVLVGDYDSTKSPAIPKTLDKLKQARPECLELRRGKHTSQRFAILREIQRRLQTDEAKKRRGPMARAFLTRNPILPAEYFAPKGLDPLVVEMNRGVEYSLLDNPSKYTVRVASFRGRTTMNLEEIARIERGGRMESQLEEAAVKAHKLTMGLRRRGYEAYEFHDLHESIVTVGRFDWVSRPRDDGFEEINPAVHKIMETFRAERRVLPGQKQEGLVPRRVEGVSLDIQPIPVEVPRQSIAAAYAAR